jgi:hypothetical protein
MNTVAELIAALQQADQGQQPLVLLYFMSKTNVPEVLKIQGVVHSGSLVADGPATVGLLVERYNLGVSTALKPIKAASAPIPVASETPAPKVRKKPGPKPKAKAEAS